MPVEYSEHPLMPGKKLFRCEQLAATITTQSCAGMWAQANGKATPERLWRCRGCRLGAEHAGASDAAMNPLRGQELCVRCGRSDLRLVKGLCCVSCQNRAYEAQKGKNAKGGKPKRHPGVFRLRLRYVADGRVQVLARDAVSVGELAVQLLRDEPKRVTLGLGRLDVAA